MLSLLRLPWRVAAELAPRLCISPRLLFSSLLRRSGFDELETRMPPFSSADSGASIKGSDVSVLKWTAKAEAPKSEQLRLVIEGKEYEVPES